LPVIEGKHIGPFAVNVAAAERRVSPERAAHLLPDRRYDRARLGYRDVSGVGNKLALIAAVIPAHVVTTHTIFCLRGAVPIELQHFLCALFNSYVLNAIVRMLMGSHVTASLVATLPAPVWSGSPLDLRIASMAAAIAATPGRSTAAELQALVGVRYGFDRPTFAAVVDSPLVAEHERVSVLAAFDSLPTFRDDFPREAVTD
jgi:hypothetical protein